MDTPKSLQEIMEAAFLVPPVDLSAYINAVVQAEHDLIKKVCEDSLQGGKYGVKVIRDATGALVDVSVDPSVPYMELHEHMDYNVIQRPWWWKELPWS